MTLVEMLAEKQGGNSAMPQLYIIYGHKSFFLFFECAHFQQLSYLVKESALDTFILDI